MENPPPLLLHSLEPVLTNDFIPLSDDEINAFFDDLDRDKDGYVTFEEIEKKLHEVHEELAPTLQRHHLLHPDRRDPEKHLGHSEADEHVFLCGLLPDCSAKINRTDFVESIRKLQVPSQKQTDSNTQDKEDQNQEHRLPFRRRLRAYLAVHGPNIAFTTFVVALQLGIGLWQMVIYIKNPLARAALGWGVILAKACAGVFYPTLVFMLLSMSRHLATFLRRNYALSRFINWDFHQKFHIYMSICGLFFASLHAIGHLTGSMLYGSRPSHQDAVARYLGPNSVPRPYIVYVRSLPGWTGITALGLFWIISLLSMPFIRKRYYEIFQLGHLLMFPMIGLLCAHGTAALLQAPMLGYWLAFPALLVILERSWRVIRGFIRVPATMKIMVDDDVVVLTCKHPRGKDWKYSAGQYILLQVPKISLFQWHPFTISSCRGDELQVHIKVDGDWTQKLRDKLPDNENIHVGVDGPFGAPAQRFYDYDYSIIVGGGIGITPFSAVLTDLEEHYSQERDPWEQRRRSRSMSRPGSRSRRTSQATTPVGSRNDRNEKDTMPRRPRNPERRVDFHWTVREKNNLLWFSDLLNRAIVRAEPLARQSKLDLNINTHITAKRKNISTHVFRYLLDGYRTSAAPYSALTGLKQRSHFGRPDFDAILEKHFNDLVDDGIRDKKVGVFYCGAPVVGEILSDKCHELTAKARDMGLRIRYDFLMEVFG
ncbi:hypothetical protein M409DRAFT_19003 [Zasmidium cellare ATCC 36951]|uniref:FAD-binding FR-type domain-containing protein n=1 Tax=Zasmidium cellare ATCC 36951 TaxID=1080233 RepID=A0A6A6CXX3_ZASCE|nr:uncharacterized protein M409DRAFT_19003 [Zasmidium cellare ATCC 36951]KAF2171030.1 hypothetical protein M409DRAFT_19003 [Zasmidium cellare ATCC 36951]